MEGGGGAQHVEGMGMCREYGWVLGSKFFKRRWVGYPEIGEK